MCGDTRGNLGKLMFCTLVKMKKKGAGAVETEGKQCHTSMMMTCVSRECAVPVKC